MIAEFRRFSGMTPQTLAADVPFHPFIWRAWEDWGGTLRHKNMLSSRLGQV
jgi:hypothetical protein